MSDHARELHRDRTGRHRPDVHDLIRLVQRVWPSRRAWTCTRRWSWRDGSRDGHDGRRAHRGTPRRTAMMVDERIAARRAEVRDRASAAPPAPHDPGGDPARAGGRGRAGRALLAGRAGGGAGQRDAASGTRGRAPGGRPAARHLDPAPARWTPPRERVEALPLVRSADVSAPRPADRDDRRHRTRTHRRRAPWRRGRPRRPRRRGRGPGTRAGPAGDPSGDGLRCRRPGPRWTRRRPPPTPTRRCPSSRGRCGRWSPPTWPVADDELDLRLATGTIVRFGRAERVARRPGPSERSSRTSTAGRCPPSTSAPRRTPWCCREDVPRDAACTHERGPWLDGPRPQV